MARIQYVVVDNITKQQVGNPQATAGAARQLANSYNLDDPANLSHRFRVRPFFSDEARTDISIELLQAKFPQLGITYGYIGNCDTIDPSRHDDRQWMIFTTVRGDDSREMRIHLDGPKFDVVEVALKLEVMAERIASKAA
jgi:hypothetical protein